MVDINKYMNKEIIYIEDDANIAEIYSMMIKDSFPELQIHLFSDGEKALEELKANPEKYSLVISDFNLPGANGGEIFKLVNGQMLGIPFIILSGFDCSKDKHFNNFFESHVRNALLLKPVAPEDLTEKVSWCLTGESDILKIYQKEAVNFDEKIPINSDIFLKLNYVPCNVYLKLNDGKFIKIIKRNEIFESRLIQKLILKDIQHFYVKRSEISLYGKTVLSTLTSLIKTKKKRIDELQKSQLTSKAIEVLKNNLLKCGVNEGTIKTTDEVVEMQLEIIISNSDLNNYLVKFQHFRKIYSDHTRIVCYIVTSMLRVLGWDSESTMHRMCLAAMLHDLSLPDEFLTRVITHDNLAQLDEKDKKTYFTHPELSSHLAKNFDQLAGGIDQIVLEHHELPDGTGFPKGLLENNIHPLSATLHLADLASDLLWEFNFETKMVKDKLRDLRPLYSRGLYRKPYDALAKVFKNS